MKITICGDVCPTGTNQYWIENEKEILFHDVLDAFQDSDRVIVNLECALTDSDKEIKKIGPALKASPVCANILREIGVTDCAISNNHIFDYGIRGVNDTLSAITQAGLHWTGFGKNYADARKNLILEHAGIKVAIIAVCEHEYCYALSDRMGTRAFHPYDTLEDIQQAKKENDYVIVLYHGGKEQSIYPSPRLREQSQAMIRQGADVVLCQHSHCVGCYENYMGGHILYGQGNFHFVNKYDDNPQWRTGLIVQVDIQNEVKLEFVPISITKHGIELAKGDKAEEILKGLELCSSHLQNEEWLNGWRFFCESKKEEYQNVIKKAYCDNGTESDNEYFSHFLYCEAHRDVWEELFKLSWETTEGEALL